MNTSITLIIPTHNRHAFLARVLDYYKDSDFSIIIVDSSSSSFRNKVPDNSHYFHWPEKSYFLKIHDALSKVSTPYVFLCADDDFINPSSVKKCINFLNENPDYASAQGHYIDFYNNRIIRFRPFPFTYIIGLDYNAEKASDRIEQLFKQYMFLHYSVHRIQNLTLTFDLLKDFPAIFGGAGQYFLDIISITNGKHKVLPVFYAAREVLLYSGANTTGSIGVIEEDEKYRLEAGKFYNILASHCGEKDNISEETAENIIRNSYNDYTKNISKLSDLPIYIHKPLGNSLISSLLRKVPFTDKLKKVYSVNIHKWYTYKRYLSKKYSRKNAILLKFTPGFPYTDKEAIEDWKKMKRIIRKHGKI